MLHARRVSPRRSRSLQFVRVLFLHRRCERVYATTTPKPTITLAHPTCAPALTHKLAALPPHGAVKSSCSLPCPPPHIAVSFLRPPHAHTLSLSLCPLECALRVHATCALSNPVRLLPLFPLCTRNHAGLLQPGAVNLCTLGADGKCRGSEWIPVASAPPAPPAPSPSPPPSPKPPPSVPRGTPQRPPPPPSPSPLPSPPPPTPSPLPPPPTPSPPPPSPQPPPPPPPPSAPARKSFEELTLGRTDLRSLDAAEEVWCYMLDESHPKVRACSSTVLLQCRAQCTPSALSTGLPTVGFAAHSALPYALSSR